MTKFLAACAAAVVLMGGVAPTVTTPSTQKNIFCMIFPCQG